MKLKKLLMCLAVPAMLYAGPTIKGDLRLKTNNVNSRVKHTADSLRTTDIEVESKLCKDNSFRIGSRFNCKNDIDFNKTKYYAVEPFIRKDLRNLSFRASTYLRSERDSLIESSNQSYNLSTCLKHFRNNKFGFSFIDEMSKRTDKKYDVKSDSKSQSLKFNYLVNNSDIKLFSEYIIKNSVSNVAIEDIVRSETKLNLNHISSDGFFRIDKKSALLLNGSYYDSKIKGIDFDANSFLVSGGLSRECFDRLVISSYGGMANLRVVESKNNSIINENKKDYVTFGVEVVSGKLGYHFNKKFNDIQDLAMEDNKILNDLDERIDRQNYLLSKGFEFKANVDKELNSESPELSYSLKGMCVLHPFARVFGSYNDRFECDKKKNSAKSLGVLLGRKKLNLELIYEHEYRAESKNKSSHSLGFSLNYGGI